MTVNASRLGAAFFVSVAIILALAATVLWFAMPVKVQAQSDLCVPAERFVEDLERQDSGVMVRWLGVDQARAYISAIMSGYVPPEIEAILFVTVNRRAAFVPVSNGVTCLSYGVVRISAESHMRGIRAVYGEPVTFD